MTYRQLVAISMVCIGLGACATVNKPIDPNAAQGIEKGVTTEQELVAKVGRNPDNASLMADGRKMVTWIYVRSQADGAMFIPFIGPFIGGVDTKTTQLQAIINQQGKVDEVMFNQSNQDMQAH